MAQFRVETVLDGEAGRYFIEVYQDGKVAPLVVGNQIYLSHEHAMTDSVEIFKAALLGQPITTWIKQQE